MLEILRFWKSVSIRKKITSSYLLTTLLGVFVISLYAYFMSNRILIDKAIGDYLGILYQFTEKLDSSLSHANSLTKLAITNNVIQDNLVVDLNKLEQAEAHASRVAINLTLAKLVESSEILSGMVIYSLHDERAFYSRGFQRYEILNPLERESIVEAFGDEDYILWKNVSFGLYKIYDEEINGFRLFRRVYNATNGRLSAIIESIIDEKDIASLYENILNTQNGYLLIADDLGVIQSSLDKTQLFKDISNNPLFKTAQKKSGGGAVLSMDGREYVTVNVFYEPLKWHIIGAIPIHSLKYQTRILTFQIFIAGLFAVALSLLIANSLSKSLTKPILALQKSVVESGNDLAARAAVTTNDEIGQLASEFNEMLDNQQIMMTRLLDEQKMLRKYELSLLQAQLNPHFLYNALENICGLIDLDRKADAHDLINEMSRFYRVVLSEGSNVISICEELELTEHYINILNVRYSGRIEYNQDVPDELMEQPIMKMTLQPLIENAIYHGLKNIAPPWVITLNARLIDRSVILELWDNGVGINQDKVSDSEFFGFGIKTTNERLKLSFGRNSGLSFHSANDGGTLVTIKLPLQTNEGNINGS